MQIMQKNANANYTILFLIQLCASIK